MQTKPAGGTVVYRRRPLSHEEAVQAHVDWLWTINRILIDGLPVDEALVAPDAHHRCGFGTWLDQALAETGGEADRARNLEQLARLHERVHETATTLLLRYRAGLPYEDAYGGFGGAVIAFNKLLAATRQRGW